MEKNEKRVHMFPESLLRPITLKGRSQDLKWWRSEPSNEKRAAPEGRLRFVRVSFGTGLLRDAVQPFAGFLL